MGSLTVSGVSAMIKMLRNSRIEVARFKSSFSDVSGTGEEKRKWLSGNKNVTLGSDAFFPFSDNIERAYKSGVKYIAQPGGSVRDDLVIECCDKYDMVMAFTGIRLFHH